jgi:teichuronic acid biosynthesis glycosyltransferase TuaH
MNQPSFLVLSANTPWVYALAEALANTHPTHAVRFYDWRNYARLRPTWSSSAVPEHLTRSIQTLPPGYAGRLEWLFRPYLQHLVRRWCGQLQRKSGEYPFVIAPYPYLAHWVRNVPNERLIYYNLDDYRLYQIDRQTRILEQEAQLVKQAETVFCLAQFQVDALQKRYPEKAKLIHHLPLGVAASYLNPHPDIPPEPKTVGYIGNLSDRVDWQLVREVATACPEIRFIFVGSTQENGYLNSPWQVHRNAVFALPNVRHIAQVPQEKVTQYYWSFALNWIPYTVTHPFNQAACPTKIMDGIASGRPVLSSDLPESRLYPEWIVIFRSVREAISQIRTQLDFSEEQSFRQLKFARQHTWKIRAHTFTNWMSSNLSV